MNQALLAKWLWRLGDDSVGLWKDVLSSKYNVVRGGWEVHSDSHQHSGIWKGILFVWNLFSKFTRLQVGKGDNVFSGWILGLGTLL